MIEYKVMQPSVWKRNYDLVSYAGWNFGNIIWNGATSFDADIFTNSFSWRVVSNIWQTNMRVLNSLGEEVGEVQKVGWSSKSILSFGGKSYLFKPLNWGSSYIWEDTHGFKMMSFKMTYFRTKQRANIRVYGEYDDELMELLMFLGYYLFHVKVQQAGG